MDPLDLKILRTMGLRPYGPKPADPEALKVARIAKQLGVEPETVRARLSKMEEAGFLRGFQVYPNLRHLGMEGSAYLFRVPDDDKKAEAIEKAELVDGLTEVHDFLGAEICLDLAYRSSAELSRRLKLLGEITGDRAPERFYDRAMPEVGRTLTSLDWRILKALRYKARRPLGEVADEVGAGVKTVRRHHARMVREGSLFAVPMVDASRAPGTILYELLFYTAPGASRAAIPKILDVLRERYLYHYVPASETFGNFDVLLAAPAAAEIEEMRRAGAKVPGVVKVSPLVFRGWRECTGWLDAAVEERAGGA